MQSLSSCCVTLTRRYELSRIGFETCEHMTQLVSRRQQYRFYHLRNGLEYDLLASRFQTSRSINLQMQWWVRDNNYKVAIAKFEICINTDRSLDRKQRRSNHTSQRSAGRTSTIPEKHHFGKERYHLRYHIFDLLVIKRRTAVV